MSTGAEDVRVRFKKIWKEEVLGDDDFGKQVGMAVDTSDCIHRSAHGQTKQVSGKAATATT